MTRSQRSIIIALALYLPAATLQEAVAAWGRETDPGSGGFGDPGNNGSADSNARFQMKAIGLLNETSGSSGSGAGCGCQGPGGLHAGPI
jgi:hypothetical protein